MTVLCFRLNNPDPYFNLATEEYLLKQADEDIFMLWSSDSSIVVGKHQNALAEINHRYVRENRIRVARRLSGGGTVFHDPGNFNFTFIRRVDRIEDVNYKIFLQPVKEALEKLGLEIGSSKRDDLILKGMKISGNAQHVYKNRVLHHGTLLFDAELGRLKAALNVDLSRFEDKAVQSNRSVVTNIADHLPRPMSRDAFADHLFESVSQSFADHRVAELGETEHEIISRMADEKYRLWDWIYGYSPKYVYRNRFDCAGRTLQSTLWIEKGKVKDAAFEGPVSDELKLRLRENLEGKNHSWEALSPVFAALNEPLEAEGISATGWLESLL